MYRLLLMFIMSISALIAKSQDASYSYKPLAKEGCSVEYSAIKQDGKSFIVVSVKSDEGLCFVSDPTMMVRTGDNKVLKLKGTNMGNRKEKSSITVIKNRAIVDNSSVGMAKFELTDEQVEMLKYGVIKIRLTTVPFIHERKFGKDKIGKKLYQAFCKQTPTFRTSLISSAIFSRKS